MTVRELMAALGAFHPDLTVKVLSGGCEAEEEIAERAEEMSDLRGCHSHECTLPRYTGLGKDSKAKGDSYHHHKSEPFVRIS